VVWFLLWTVLVLGAGALFALLGRSLWKKGLALYRELESAMGRLGAALEPPLERDSTEPAELGIFADVTEVRRQLSAGRGGVGAHRGKSRGGLPARRYGPPVQGGHRTPGPPPVS
jgi:hypothetical protein